MEATTMPVMRKCGLACEVYSRPVGFYRPVKHWNRGKREEFRQRRMFKVPPLI